MEAMRKYLRAAVGLVCVGLTGYTAIGLRISDGPRIRVLPRAVALVRKRVEWATPAQSALVAVAEGPVLYAKNAQVERPIASVTKMMTANLVLTHPALYPPNRLVAVTPAEVANERRGIAKGDSEVAIHAGERVSIRDLLYALMLPSADDSAWILADQYPGGAPAFLAAMNARARLLGMDETHYVDPDGVNHRGYSTANNLLRLIRRDMQIPEFRRLVRTKTQQTQFGKLVNLNQLLWTYPGAIGIKTGWTPYAGSCLAFAAVQRHGTLALGLYGVVLDEPSFVSMFADVRRLLSTGFERVGYQTLFKAGTVVAVERMPGGWLAGSRQETWVLKRPLGQFAVNGQARLVVRWTKGLGLPYQAGQVGGYARLQQRGEPTVSVPIVATTTVRVHWWNRL